MKRVEKKAEILMPVVVFLVLTLLFFVPFIYAVATFSDSSVIYEQAYAKKIALLIDGAKPRMEFEVNFSKCIEIASDNKKIDNLVWVDDKRVFVALDYNKAYFYEFFSSNKVSIEEDFNKGVIKIIVKENVEG